MPVYRSTSSQPGSAAPARPSHSVYAHAISEQLTDTVNVFARAIADTGPDGCYPPHGGPSGQPQCANYPPNL